MSRASLTLEQLIALNDEIAAIVRMGVPLELGLRELGTDLPGQLGRVVERLQRDLEAGQSLDAALAHPDRGFPPAYQAIVLAGLRAGRLPAALQSLAESARRVAEVSRSLRTAMFYPLLVVSLAYLILVAFVAKWIPLLIGFYDDASLPALPLLNGMSAVSQTVWWWAPLFPLAAGVLIARWYHRSRHATEHSRPGIRRQAHWATFCELLATLIEHDVPLPQALPLAGHACADAQLSHQSEQWAEQLKRGEAIASGSSATDQSFGWLAWLLRQGQDRAILTRQLQRSAESYRAEVLKATRWWMHTFPLLVTVAMGGTSVLVMALLILGPWFHVLYHLGDVG